MSRHLNAPDVARVVLHLNLHKTHKQPRFFMMIGSKMCELRISEMDSTSDNEPSFFLEPEEFHT